MTIDGSFAIFGVGCAGGVLAELLHWWNLRESEQLPAYASRPLYWVITTAMVFAGGFIAWLYFGARGETIIVAHVGISTPLLLQKLVTSLPDKTGSKSIIAKPGPSVKRFFRW